MMSDPQTQIPVPKGPIGKFRAVISCGTMFQRSIGTARWRPSPGRCSWSADSPKKKTRTNVFKNATQAAALASILAGPAMAEAIVLYAKLDFAEDVAAAFTSKTGIEVDLVEPDSTGDLLNQIEAEQADPQFDIVWVDGSAVLLGLLQDRILQPVPNAAFEGVDFTELGASLIPSTKAFFPTGVSTTAIAVNTDKVDEADWPESWADLIDFSGFVAAKDPNYSGPAFHWLAGLFQTNGVEASQTLLEAVLTNAELASFSSGGKVNKAVIEGDALVGINQDSSIINKAGDGDPLQVIYPKEGSVALPQGLGVSAVTEHMDAVLQFIAFVVSQEGQSAQMAGDKTDNYYIPVFRGISPKPGRPTDINFIELDIRTATAHETEWKDWYRRTLTE